MQKRCKLRGRGIKGDEVPKVTKDTIKSEIECRRLYLGETITEAELLKEWAKE